MSTCPGVTLEALLDWEYSKVTPELVMLYEPHREAIESWLLDFDEEQQGWRTYASYWDEIFKVDPIQLKAALSD